QDSPFLQRVFGNDHRAGRRVELTSCLEQHVAHEAMKVRLTGEALEIAADNGVRLRQFGDLLFGSALPGASDVIYQALPVEGRTDDTGRGLQGWQLREVDRPALLGVVETNNAGEFPT